ncbi:ABC transporter permease [Ilumatobacter sp.]|uniref:ABC transporter permease n=1 Tax=Ilumatobacter sp. TaxID=1967498 RepID=UPI003B523604
MSAPRRRARGDGAPPILVVLGAVAAALFVVPLVGLLDVAPWSRMPDLLTDETVVDALALSLVTSLAAAGASVLLGVPLAWLLSRTRFPGRSILRAVVTLPMVLPPVVGGAALLVSLGRRGIVGQPLDSATGIVLPFSIWGVIVANTFVAMPFLVITVDSALGGLDGRHESAAATLGASRAAVLRRITLPMIAPAVKAGAILAWARAFGEFGATVTFAGNLQGRTQTLPLAVFVALDGDRDAAIAISLLMVAVSVAVLVVLRDRWWTPS